MKQQESKELKRKAATLGIFIGLWLFFTVFLIGIPIGVYVNWITPKGGFALTLIYSLWFVVETALVSLKLEKKSNNRR